MNTQDKKAWLEQHGSLSVDDGTHYWETMYGDQWYNSDLLNDMIAAHDIDDADKAVDHIYDIARDVLWERMQDIRTGSS